jgi:hypothetical protein
MGERVLPEDKEARREGGQERNEKGGELRIEDGGLGIGS